MTNNNTRAKDDVVKSALSILQDGFPKTNIYSKILKHCEDKAFLVQDQVELIAYYDDYDVVIEIRSVTVDSYTLEKWREDIKILDTIPVSCPSEVFNIKFLTYIFDLFQDHILEYERGRYVFD